MEVDVQDDTGSTIFVIFNEEGKNLTGQEAKQLQIAHLNEVVSFFRSKDYPTSF